MVTSLTAPIPFYMNNFEEKLGLPFCFFTDETKLLRASNREGQAGNLKECFRWVGELDMSLKEGKSHSLNSVLEVRNIVRENGEFWIGSIQRPKDLGAAMNADHKFAGQCTTAVQRPKGSSSGCGLRYPMGNRGYLFRCSRQNSGHT